MRKRFEYLIILCVAACVGVSGYALGQLLKKDLPYVQEHVPYHYKNIRNMAGSGFQEIKETFEIGTRVTNAAYGVLRQSISFDIKLIPQQVTGTAILSSYETAQQMKPGMRVVLFTENNKVLSEPAIISSVDLSMKKSTLHLAMPPQVQENKEHPVRGEVALFEASNIKMLPLSARVLSDEGKYFVWRARAQGDHYIAERVPAYSGLNNDQLFEAGHQIGLDDAILMNPSSGLKDGDVIEQIAWRHFDVPVRTSDDMMAHSVFDQGVENTRRILLQIKADKEEILGATCAFEVDPMVFLTDNPPPKPLIIPKPAPPTPPKASCTSCSAAKPVGDPPIIAPAATITP
ncbi:MAG: hypothetical protein J0L77_09200 [Alphaproteobacteria bacterium]|nr:hypothetical protein [Alphaproteobacteria bacterium]